MAVGENKKLVGCTHSTSMIEQSVTTPNDRKLQMTPCCPPKPVETAQLRVRVGDGGEAKKKSTAESGRVDYP